MATKNNLSFLLHIVMNQAMHEKFHVSCIEIGKTRLNTLRLTKASQGILIYNLYAIIEKLFLPMSLSNKKRAKVRI